MEFNPTLLIDFYKVGHVVQYPPTTKRVWSNFTPRSSRVPGQNEVVFFGLQYLIKEYLVRQFDDHFFARPKGSVIAEYREFIRATLGKQDPKTDHIEWLHDQGCLPVDIYAIPEGYSVPFNVPVLVITNTLPEAFWVPNYLETLLSCILWKPMTSATTAQRFRRLFVRYAQRLLPHLRCPHKIANAALCLELAARIAKRGGGRIARPHFRGRGYLAEEEQSA